VVVDPIMATKAKARTKPTKKSSSRPAASAKPVRIKAKAHKPSAAPLRSGVKNPPSSAKVSAPTKVAPKRTPAVAPEPSLPKPKPRQYANAIQAYEAGIRLFHSEQFEKAIECFEGLIAEHPDEPEIQDRAKVLIHAAEKKLHDRERTVLRSAEDHYNVGIADLNRRALDSAVQHLQQALKLAPKADHVLYALAAASALQGNRNDALEFLKQSIQNRPENRFLAARDSDFETLLEDTDFKQLMTPPEK
jgi:tetratricopeptide (TPR) repeat protein